MGKHIKEFFYRPDNAWAADFIPFFEDGIFRLFYLHDRRNKEKYGEGTSWYQISTRDFVTIDEHCEMLPRGKPNEQDLYVYTGCVIKADTTYHIFYTGHNPHLKKMGKPQEGVMHAVSNDMLQWEKIPEDTFCAREDIYEKHDWRDPFVFWNDEAGEYWMLLAARLTTKLPSRRRGCIALCTSKDLKKWDIREPFWSPGLYYTHECPDLFKIGGWWYLIFSTFSERFVTHYRMSKSLKGPWLAPENDTFDGRAYYAAKTCSNGVRRFLCGWNPTREQEKDYSAWQWGGNLVVHEIIRDHNGTLSVKVPESIDNAFSQESKVFFSPHQGKWELSGNKISADAQDSFASAIAVEMPFRCKISTTVTFSKNTDSCGIFLRAGTDMEKMYYVRLEPKRNRLVFDSWPRKGDVPFMVELERPVHLIPGMTYEFTIFADITICEVYVNDTIAMSARMYDHKEGKWGVFVTGGEAVFCNSGMWTLT